ncbi:glutaminase [Pigmentiphaga litoralis]|uniref:Glutaminase n=1 Tax=Pigmentiphaga litoralis TaxID=516702 RepID=A0A7Y9J0V8_9BURK|nr:glutaminase [Pigmentiphaga litoralis]NYE26816.1 glutaminase [Pigmentiphaga litoralis]NYE85774.1 glutaminase [Pigmentiphaga litoralis]
MPLDYQAILDEINDALRPELGQEGKVADYIPALARVPADRFGIALRTCDGFEAASGDSNEAFSIQSISKLFSLTLALQRVGDQVWDRIGREPSGNPFNSLVQLEREEGVPRNPFINAGAIAVADRLVSATKSHAKTDIVELISSLCGDKVMIDQEVAQSEAANGYRNVAVANFMKSFDKFDNNVAQVLDVYFNQCAIQMSCVQLARAAGFLCRDGGHPYRGKSVVSERQARRLNALMLTCGTYDSAGEFAFLVGLPCKSGVGGGIVAVVPETLSLCVWSPAIDESGNSHLGRKALEMFVARTRLSIF